MVVEAGRQAMPWQILGAWRLRGSEPSVVVVDGNKRLPPLLCLVVVHGPDEEGTTSQVIEAIGEVYNDPAPASLTTRLSRVVRAAHSTLQAANAHCARGELHEAALVCLAQRGERAYLAHAGPVVCYACGPEGSVPRRVLPSGLAATTLPLGHRAEAEVSLTTVHPSPDGALALAAGPLAQRLGDDDWVWLLQDGHAAVSRRLGQIRSRRNAPDVVLALLAPARDEHCGDREATRRVRSVRPAAHARPVHGASQQGSVRPADPIATPPATLPAHHSLAVASSVVFASLSILMAAALLIWQIQEAAPVVEESPSLASVSAPTSAARADDMRTLSARGRTLGGEVARVAQDEPQEQAASPPATIQLGSLRELVHLADGAVGDLALADRTLLVADAKRGRIVKYLLDPSGPPVQTEILWQAGERRGSVTLGRPARLALAPASGSTSPEIVLATEEGVLWRLAQGRAQALPALPDTVRPVRLTATPQHLFALAGPPGAVWALSLTAGERHWQRFTSADTALDMATDGAVYLVHGDGRLTRHADNMPLPFGAIVPGEPLRTPRAIAAQASWRGVYVLDPGRERVIEFTKDGQFRRQFRYTPDAARSDLRALVLDERRGWLITASQERIFFAPLPR